MDVNAADIGQHWLELEKQGIPDSVRGAMLRRFANQFANLVAGENGEVFLGVLQQGEEDEIDGDV